MQKIFTLLIALIMCVTGSGAVMAAAINDDGAAQLKKMIESELGRYAEIKSMGGQGLIAEGAVDVVPHGTFYKATISEVSFFLSLDRRLNIGIIALNAVPGPQGTWEIKAAIPATMRLYDKNNKSLADVMIGSQRIAATWIPSEGLYPRADSLFEKIKISALGDAPFRASLGKVHMTSSLRDNGDGTWTGPGGFEATDIKMEASGKNAVVIEIGKAVATSLYNRINLGKIMESRRKLMKIAESGKMPETQEDRQLLLDLHKSVESMSSSFDISDVLIHEKSATKSMEIKFDNLSFQGRLQGMQQEKSAVHLKSSFNGLKISSVPLEFTNLTPHTMNIEMDIKNLPIKKIIENISTIPRTGENNTPFINLPEILQQSGTSLLIQNSFFRSQEMNIGFTGNLDSNAASVTGMSGKMTLSVKGLEPAISLLQTLATKPGADMKMVGYASGLTGVMLMGRSAKNAKGEKVNNYDLEMTPDGKLLINGLNIMTLVKAGGVLNQHINHNNPLVKKISP